MNRTIGGIPPVLALLTVLLSGAGCAPPLGGTKEWPGSYSHGSPAILPGGARPMGGYPYASGIVVVRNNIPLHGKGFAVLDADASDPLYRRAAREYAGRRLAWREFRRLAEAGSGRGLRWFFEDWARSDKVLECRVVAKGSVPSGEGYASEARVEYGMRLDGSRIEARPRGPFRWAR